MIAILAFLTVVALLVLWWISRQGLMVKPWLETDSVATLGGADQPRLPPAQIGLGIFLAVVGSLFALLISAYVLRAQLGDWRGFPLPGIVWANSLPLLAASLALEWARVRARHGDIMLAQAGVIGGMGAAAVFIAGQLWAWTILTANGYAITSGPAGSFFYLMTAAHGLHVIGGIVALARPIAKIRRADDVAAIRLSIDLAATYWLFMLLVWVVLLLVLSGWAAAFLALCGRIIAGSG
ncbi:cytochrome c oxidase subunit 3 [Pelagibacterium xiamenense]|uniref:cytochrome c oxidase subunit 3 n=1 Tax=Pelagibacterium xiamenense TaxID=2901140 RepID=UPI001E35C17F|nr:cytochrome c oxidase subunit 3 [Pelagibacterium xiamenense]MCD7058401.1 cytochrome c oxidase subunit 3 [Pelagibacterium xiamenense]